MCNATSQVLWGKQKQKCMHKCLARVTLHGRNQVQDVDPVTVLIVSSMHLQVSVGACVHCHVVTQTLVSVCACDVAMTLELNMD
jgi:hypothetical protein